VKPPAWVVHAEAQRDHLLTQAATRKTCRDLARAHRRLAVWHHCQFWDAAQDNASIWREAFTAEQNARRDARYWQDRADTWRPHPHTQEATRDRT
jgi:hypothetical protein